jgi:hypothetical protein
VGVLLLTTTAEVHEQPDRKEQDGSTASDDHPELETKSVVSSRGLARAAGRDLGSG